MFRRFALALLLLLACGPAFADDAQPLVTPGVLSPSDVARYRKIIAAERAGRFAEADKLFDAVDDKSLEGYVLAERYLSPKSKRTPVKKLVAWLNAYGELPIAGRVHNLAVKRATKKVHRRHHRTVTVVTAHVPDLPGTHFRGGGYEDADLPNPAVISVPARAVLDQINAFVRADQPDQANGALQALIAQNTASAHDIASLAHRVCMSYLAEGMDDQAFALGESMATTGRLVAPQLDWCAGLAAFRLGKYTEAAGHFEIVAQVAMVPNWNRAAAAFWAARAYMRSGDSQKVVTLLTVAASNQPTFYGLLAEKLLGEDIQTGFSDPVLLPGDFQTIMQRSVPAHRAIALWQVADPKYASFARQELNRAFGQAGRLRLDSAFAALARALDAPNIELRASETSYSHGLLLTGLFPVPRYQPLGGYTIDPSLVLAVARIETRFVDNAVSPAGAVGLMQIMPSTARLIGGRGAEDELLDPTYNMTLGQRFIAQLLNRYNGNIVHLAAAYNAGPGKVTAWTAARAGKEDDPLMFIESMRASETRSYVKRLLTYYWMYHRRSDRPAPSLDEMARGGWPIYRAPQQSAPPPPPPATDEDDDDDDDTSDNTSS